MNSKFKLEIEKARFNILNNDDLQTKIKKLILLAASNGHSTFIFHKDDWNLSSVKANLDALGVTYRTTSTESIGDNYYSQPGIELFVTAYF